MRGNHLVKEARRRAGITQRELAERVGTTQSAIARLERAEYSPTLEHITKLVRACGYDVGIELYTYDVELPLHVGEALHGSPERRLATNVQAANYFESIRGLANRSK
jgi:transcriptional regulator with XRE-family HTH domain